MTTKINMFIGAIAIIVVVALVIFLTGGAQNLGIMGAAPSGVPILLTDPPYVPAGTTSLSVNYSSVAVLYTNGSQSTWINAQGSGTVNLLSLVNVTELIANASVPKGSVISRARFNVSSASITINGTTYPVVTPSPQIIANISSNQAVNGSTSVIVDLSPIVVTVFTNNQTLFIMVPSVKAIVVGNETVRTGLHGKAPLPTNITTKFGPSPNITVTGVSLDVIGNTTQLSMTVKNNANRTVELNHLLLFGNETSTISNSPCPYTCSDGSPCVAAGMPCRVVPPRGIEINATGNVSGGVLGAGVAGIGHRVIHAEDASLSGDMAANAEVTVHENATTAIMYWQRFRVVNFFIQSNGTLALPFDRCTYEMNVGVLPGGEISSNASIETKLPGAYVNGSVAGAATLPGGYIGRLPPIRCIGDDFGEYGGLTIQPGQSATLHFNGTITLGYGIAYLKPIMGQLYKIRIFGEEGARASANVTAA
jgi:hypothetical protein